MSFANHTLCQHRTSHRWHAARYLVGDCGVELHVERSEVRLHPLCKYPISYSARFGRFRHLETAEVDELHLGAFLVE
eukprot:564757-Rhodomonas_salina.2